ncbi:MAG: cob(I)yrinic acid a,c-diamide adenosyltransferase [Planctomycetaceae bacterium]|nr:cob(I)yrinic acid a,c-diamide adenosyltransferase [Planctomycetaceae bacterium]
MVRLDRIYTGGGDAGETSLGDGARVSKLDPRIVALGAVDEVNCTLGLAATHAEAELAEQLRSLQQLLFDLGADLCLPLPDDASADFHRRLTSGHVAQLERQIDACTERLQPLKSFILPGGTPAAAALHLARAICRRAEICVLSLHENQGVNPVIPVVLNRLSDLLFTLARIANVNGTADILWNPARGGAEDARESR